MLWMDRNHGRLLRVCQNETRKLSPPNVQADLPPNGQLESKKDVTGG